MRYSLKFKNVYVFTDQHSSCSMRLNDALNMFMSVNVFDAVWQIVPQADCPKQK